jgi:hypothetical protein
LAGHHTGREGRLGGLSRTTTVSPSQTPLAQSDPGIAGWHRDLSGSYSKFASAFTTGGENANALNALGEGRVIMERLTKLSPENAEWKRDLALVRWADCRVGTVTCEVEREDRACEDQSCDLFACITFTLQPLEAVATHRPKLPA